MIKVKKQYFFAIASGLWQAFCGFIEVFEVF
jgi:hypothetical protein